MNDTVTPIDAERHVLSAMLTSLNAVWEVTATMRVSDMGEPRHETIAQAIYDLATSDEIVGPIAVTSELERRGELNRIGGPAYLFTLDGFTPTPANAAFYAAIVHDTAKRRRAGVAAEQIRQAVTDKTLDVDDVLDRARAVLEQAVHDTVVGQDPDPQAELLEALESVGTAAIGYPSRFHDLNEHMHGFQPGALYVIGARPGVGKSAVALQLATDLAKN